MGVAKLDFLRYVGADQIVIENAEHFAWIDLDLSDFEKECTQNCTSSRIKGGGTSSSQYFVKLSRDVARDYVRVLFY